jgi:hypothetical protein
MKKPFEDYLAFIEHELGCKLFDWQKIVLRNEYEGKHYCRHFGRISGKYAMYRAAEILKEEMDRDNGILPWFYKLDGYTTDVVIYDEWEKENQ